MSSSQFLTWLQFAVHCFEEAALKAKNVWVHVVKTVVHLQSRVVWWECWWAIWSVKWACCCSVLWFWQNQVFCSTDQNLLKKIILGRFYVWQPVKMHLEAWEDWSTGTIHLQDCISCLLFPHSHLINRPVAIDTVVSSAKDFLLNYCCSRSVSSLTRSGSSYLASPKMYAVHLISLD